VEATFKLRVDTSTESIRSSDIQRPARVPSDPGAASEVYDDLSRMGRLRVNLLVAGADGAIAPLLEALRTHFEKPVATWSPGQPLVLPPVDQTGTLLIRDVGALTIDDQIQLLEWLATATGRTQVVSTTAAPLLPRVRAGAFIDTLYYRLNTVYVDATA
jgi:hypothetical protein